LPLFEQGDLVVDFVDFGFEFRDLFFENGVLGREVDGQPPDFISLAANLVGAVVVVDDKNPQKNKPEHGQEKI
jgi:hypothetical protein